MGGQQPVQQRTEGRVDVGLAAGEDLRWAAADFTELVEGVRAKLDLSPLASAALGRCLIGATLLLRLSTKGSARLLLDVRGDGPLGRILVEVASSGHLRGTVQNPRASLPPTREGKLAVGDGVGRGFLRVRRESESNRSYESEVELETGEIGDDLAHFLDQSDQIRSAVLLGVLARSRGIAGAGGAIVQALPEASEETLRRLERNLSDFGSISDRVEKRGLEGVSSPLLDGFDRRVLSSRRYEYLCGCSREKIAGHLAGLSVRQLAELESADGHLEVECVFCGKNYRINGRQAG